MKVWKHVILAYAKCNSHDVSWQARISTARHEDSPPPCQPLDLPLSLATSIHTRGGPAL